MHKAYQIYQGLVLRITNILAINLVSLHCTFLELGSCHVHSLRPRATVLWLGESDIASVAFSTSAPLTARWVMPQCITRFNSKRVSRLEQNLNLQESFMIQSQKIAQVLKRYVHESSVIINLPHSMPAARCIYIYIICIHYIYIYMCVCVFFTYLHGRTLLELQVPEAGFLHSWDWPKKSPPLPTGRGVSDRGIHGGSKAQTGTPCTCRTNTTTNGLEFIVV